MPNQSGKTSNFLKAINKYAEEQRTKIRNEAENFKKEEIEKAESEILNDIYILIQKEMAEMKAEIAKEMSKKELDSRKNLFEKRNSITKKVFEKSKLKLLEFTKTNEYPKLLAKYAKAISSVLVEPGTIIYVRKEDLCFSDTIKEAFGCDCNIEIKENIKIGGIYSYNPNMGLIADETLDSKLEEQHIWFAENSGLKLK